MKMACIFPINSFRAGKDSQQNNDLMNVSPRIKMQIGDKRDINETCHPWAHQVILCCCFFCTSRRVPEG